MGDGSPLVVRFDGCVNFVILRVDLVSPGSVEAADLVDGGKITLLASVTSSTGWCLTRQFWTRRN